MCLAHESPSQIVGMNEKNESCGEGKDGKGVNVAKTQDVLV